MEVTLQLRNQFVEVLKDYQPSKETLDALAGMPLVILLGVSGSGKNTIIDKLVETGRYHYIVSDTTRPPKVRNGVLEQDGVAYNFRSEEDILSDLKEGKFLEAELIHNQQVSGNNVREITKAHASGKVAINEVDVGGTDAIAELKPDTLFLFIIPPNFKEWMRRLQVREVMTEGELQNRIFTAIKILRAVLSSERFVYVINDSLDEVVSTVDDYIHGKHHERHNQGAREAATQLLRDIEIQYPELV